MCSQAEENDVPLSQVFGLAGSLPVVADNKKANIEEHGVSSPSPSVEKLLRSLETRMAVMETSVGNALSGITDIMSFMVDIKRCLSGEGVSKNVGDMHATPATGVRACTSNPSQWYVHGRTESTPQRNGRTSTVTGSPTSSAEKSPSLADVARGACSTNPLLVPEDESSDNAEKKKWQIGRPPYRMVQRRGCTATLGCGQCHYRARWLSVEQVMPKSVPPRARPGHEPVDCKGTRTLLVTKITRTLDVLQKLRSSSQYCGPKTIR